MTAPFAMRNPVARRTYSRATPLAIMGLLWFSAAMWQVAFGSAPDVTWLTVASERLIDGETLYRTILETNPPASVYLYTPGVLIARLAGLSSEIGVLIWVLLLAAFLFGSSLKIAVEAGCPAFAGNRWLPVWISLLLVVMPMSTFAQREHIAALLSLPVLAASLVRAGGKAPTLWAIIVAGVSAGLVVAIKPTVIFVPVFVSVAAALISRNARMVLAPENWIGAFVACSYALFVYLAHPLFFTETLPFLRDVYMPARFAIIAVALPTFHMLIFLSLYFVIIHRRSALAAPVALTLAVAAGFAASYFWQMKFFDYHAMPIAAFLMLAAILAQVLEGEELASRATAATNTVSGHMMRVLSVAIFVLFAAYNMKLYYGNHYDGRLQRAIAAQGSVRVAGLSNHIGPWLREIRLGGGQWIGSFGPAIAPGFAAWYRKNLDVDPDWNRRLLLWENWTSDAVLRDLKVRKPELFLIAREGGFSWLAWIEQHPKLHAEMKRYRLVQTVNVNAGQQSFLLYRRVDAGAGMRPHQDGQLY